MKLDDCRKEIDAVDAGIVKLFAKRMEISKKISAIKKENSIPVLNEEREKEVVSNAVSLAPDDLKEYTAELYAKILELSRDIQK